MSDWNYVKIKDIERIFKDVFNPENLYGFQAVLYDDAIVRANNYGTSWKDEMEKDGTYLTFLIDYLTEEGITPDELIIK